MLVGRLSRGNGWYEFCDANPPYGNLIFSQAQLAVGQDKVPAKQGIEGTVNDVMDESFVPSIRQ